jgi:hypothetical protein
LDRRERPDRGAVLLVRVGTWGNGYSNFTDATGQNQGPSLRSG